MTSNLPRHDLLPKIEKINQKSQEAHINTGGNAKIYRSNGGRWMKPHLRKNILKQSADLGLK